MRHCLRVGSAGVCGDIEGTGDSGFSRIEKSNRTRRSGNFWIEMSHHTHVRNELCVLSRPACVELSRARPVPEFPGLDNLITLAVPEISGLESLITRMRTTLFACWSGRRVRGGIESTADSGFFRIEL